MSDDDHKKLFHRNFARRPFIIVLVYAVISGIYILYSDILVHTSFNDPETVEQISIAKGWIYVGISAALLYWMISRLLSNVLSLSSQQQALKNETLRILGLLQSIANNSTDAIFAKDIEGRYLLFNKQASSLIGKPANEVIGQDDSALFPPDQAALIKSNDRQVIQSGEVQVFEEVLETTQGQLAFLATKAPLLDAEGKLVGLFGISRDITLQRKAELELKESESSYRSLTEQVPFIVYRAALDENSTTLYISPRVEIFGYPQEMWLANSALWVELMHPDDQDRVFESIALAHQGQPLSVEYRMKMPSGEWRYFLDEARLVLDELGKPYCLQGMMMDVTERRQAEERMRKLSQAVEQSPVSTIITDVEGRIEYVNKAFVTMSGYSAEEALGSNPRFLGSNKMPAESIKALWEKLTSGEVWQGEFINRCKNGEERIEYATIAPVRTAEGKVTHYLSVQQDITAQKHSEAQIHHLAYFDGLTGLPNRTLLADRLTQMTTLSGREHSKGALILFNIDHFKHLNDARGHGHGDQLLVALGERLLPVLREGDTLARIGGDEFAILIQGMNQNAHTISQHAAAVARKLHEALRRLFLIGRDEVFITVSAGITVFPEVENDNAENVLRRADIALHRAKDEGGNQTVFFESDIGKNVEQYFQIVRELHIGVPSGQMRLFIQSQVDAAGRVVGAEALVRWMHPERGLVSPAVFIPVAEESDLIIEIGAWVFTEVCHLLVKDAFQASPCRRISVNISPRHFKQSNFVPWLKNVLATTGADPTHITLEVTEGLVIDHVNEVIAKMAELRDIGIHFSIDDFGTGYSSLAYLKRLPIHELKIDKTFVQDAPDDPDDAALVEAILAVAKHLHLKVVAEGVETHEQADFLQARAQVIMQGYLYSRPQPADEWLQTLTVAQ